MYVKEIIYDRETRDFALYLDGELVGFARSYADGERFIDTILAERGRRGRLAAANETVTDALTRAAGSSASWPPDLPQRHRPPGDAPEA